MAASSNTGRKLKRGKAIVPGDTIGVIALSSPCEEVRFMRGIKVLEAFGFKVRIALTPAAEYGTNKYLFSSDTAEARARALEELFADPGIAAIISARGAYGSGEILSLVDWKAIAKHPKTLVGFSDTTAILNALVTQSGLVAVHGPSIESAFSKSAEVPEARRAAEALIRFLTAADSNPLEGLTFEHFTGSREGAGKLVGGNLSTLVSLLGTPFAPRFDDGIIFLEELGESPFRVHRMLRQLKLAGAFDRARGVVLGSFARCVHPKGLGPTVTDVFKDVFKECAFPVLHGGAFGHQDLNLPIPLGVEAKITGNKLELNEPAVLH